MIQVATFKNEPMYALTAADYIKMRMMKKDYNEKAYYIISDKKNCVILKDNVVAYAFENAKYVRYCNGGDWKKAVGYVEPVVITERPTVEALATEGDRRLRAVLEESPVVEANAETRLNELVDEGEKAVEKVIAEGETIRNAVMAAEPQVKRKRTPRKYDRGA